MKIGDVVGAAGFEHLAEVALGIAALAFLLVVITTVLKRNAEPFERARFMPLDRQENPHE
jgi:hypothetical protein